MNFKTTLAGIGLLTALGTANAQNSEGTQLAQSGNSSPIATRPASTERVVPATKENAGMILAIHAPVSKPSSAKGNVSEEQGEGQDSKVSILYHNKFIYDMFSQMLYLMKNEQLLAACAKDSYRETTRLKWIVLITKILRGTPESYDAPLPEQVEADKEKFLKVQRMLYPRTQDRWPVYPMVEQWGSRYIEDPANTAEIEALSRNIWN